MSVVLVTGGTGTLGRRVVTLLVEQGHEVRVMSRRDASPSSEGATRVRADVLTGAGLERATEGADVVIHAASSPRRDARATEVDGTRKLLAALAPQCHLVYVSIVGVDRSRFPYHQAKLAAERLVERREGPWTIQRATQFHQFLDYLLARPVFVRTPHLAFQPVHAGEVAGRLVELVAVGPSARAPDFGGPEVVSLRELARQRRAVAGHAARLIALPPLGFLRDLDRGHHLCPGERAGVLTWQEWLRRKHAAAG